MAVIVSSRPTTRDTKAFYWFSAQLCTTKVQYKNVLCLSQNEGMISVINIYVTLTKAKDFSLGNVKQLAGLIITSVSLRGKLAHAYIK